MGKIKIIVSYSHENEEWVSKEGKYKLIPWLDKQLDEQAEIWTDHALKRHIGEEYTKLITQKINDADIVLLMISQEFVASSFIMDIELPLIQQQFENKKLKILPLLITVLTKKGKEKIKWIFDLQTYPNDKKPLVEFANNDAEWVNVKVEILDGIENTIDMISKSTLKEIHNEYIPKDMIVVEDVQITENITNTTDDKNQSILISDLSNVNILSPLSDKSSSKVTSKNETKDYKIVLLLFIIIFVFMLIFIANMNR